jgi:hypothetical protein
MNIDVGDRVQFKSTKDPAEGTVRELVTVRMDRRNYNNVQSEVIGTDEEKCCWVDWDDGYHDTTPVPMRYLLRLNNDAGDE